MIAGHKGEVPIAVYTLPLLAGIGIGCYLPAVSLSLLLIIFSILLSLFIGLNVFYTRAHIFRHRWLGGLLLHALLIFTGWIAIVEHDQRNSPVYFGRVEADHFVVKIADEPRESNGYIRFACSVQSALKNVAIKPASGLLMVTIKADSLHHYRYGDELLIPARQTEISPPLNPGEFNYKQYLAHQQIYQEVFLMPGQCVQVGKGAGNPLIAFSLKLRQSLVDKFKYGMHDPEAVGVASTLILGYKADLSPDVLQAYSNTGTIHVLSVSGAHVAIIYVFISFALSFLNRFRYGKFLKAGLAMLLIWFYAMLTGFSPAVCRAAVMLTMVIAGKSFNRYINTVNILALSAFILLLYNPLLITDVGFQLSYLAVLGLVVFQPVIYELIEFKHRWAKKLWYYIAASIAAQVITFPLSAFYFHQFPVYFLLSNLFIIIPSEIIMFAGIIYLLLPRIPILSTVIGFVLEKSILLMDKGLALIEHAPYASISKIWINNVDCLLLFLAVVLVFYFLSRQNSRYLRVALACILLAVVSSSFKKSGQHTTGSITFLSLRKHIGILFRKGGEAILVTDVKQQDKTFTYSIKPGLDSNKIAHLILIAPDSNFKNTWFEKEGGFIQFKNEQLFLLNTSAPMAVIPNFDPGYLVIMGNRPFNLKNWQHRGLKKIVVNGDSPDTFSNTLKKSADSMRINFYSLKRNKSVEVLSND